ncbi:MAG: Crp/Fnr family transcriptional regulator [Anaerolineae bacterium]|nr:Crp/Fnr family transcriptional regulator [Anaerolineae bacterium]
MSQSPGKIIARIPYFSDLEPKIREEVAEVAIRRSYPANYLIFNEGEPCAGLYIVEDGLMRIFKTAWDGREQVLHFVGPGQTFNDVATFDGGPNPASAITVEPTVLWIIERAAMQRLLRTYPSIGEATVRVFAARMRHLIGLVEDLSFRSVTARVAKLLLQQRDAARADSVERPALMTHQEMAARLGTVREMIGRALRALADIGAIRIERHRIVIVDRAALEKKAEL